MKANFDSIINDTKPVIIDFHALWCGPCKAQSPVLKELASKLGNRVRVIKIDVDNELVNCRWFAAESESDYFNNFAVFIRFVIGLNCLLFIINLEFFLFLFL